MGLEQISYNGPVLGIQAIKAGSAGFGIEDAARQQETVAVGMAAAWADSASQAALKNYYKFGNALARADFAGVVATTGTAPQLEFPVCTRDSEVSQICFAGIAPVLLAPGEVVRRGQHLQPIAVGASAGYFRPAVCGPVVAQQAADNSAGSTAMLISGLILGGCAGEGLLYSAGPSDELTDVAVETVYAIGAVPIAYDLPANSLAVGDRLRVTFGVRSGAASGGAYEVRGYVDGIGSADFFLKSVTFTDEGEVIQGQVDLYVASLTGANNVSAVGMVAGGIVGTAPFLASSAARITMDTTVENSISIAATPSAIGESTTLLFMSVEKL